MTIINAYNMNIINAYNMNIISAYNMNIINVMLLEWCMHDIIVVGVGYIIEWSLYCSYWNLIVDWL